MEKNRFVIRHSIKPKGDDKESAQYKGISDKGVELARQSAKNELLDYLEKTPDRAVIILGGASDFSRTKSTARVIGAELKQLLADRASEYVVITDADLPRNKGYTAIIKDIKQVIDANPDKRIVVDVPLYLKEFSMVSRGYCTKDEKPGEFMERIRVRRQNDKDNEQSAIKEWIENNGRLDGVQGPNPLESAKQVEKGIIRLETFAQKYVKNRPIVAGIVGHGWELDAYLTYAVGHGKLSGAAWDAASSGKGMLVETEFGSVRIGDEMTIVLYRGKTHVNKNLEHIVEIVTVLSFFNALSKSGITGNVVGFEKNGFLSIMPIILFLVSLLIFVFLKTKNRK